MTGPLLDLGEIDPLTTAGVFAALSGAVSVAWSFFDGLTTALVALAGLAWFVQWSRSGRPIGRGVAMALRFAPWGAVGAGVAFVLVAPPGWSVLDGVAIGAPGAALAWSSPDSAPSWRSRE